MNAFSSSDEERAASWAVFAGASTSDEFCRAWLALQCSMVPDVQAGLVLLRDDEAQSYIPAAIWPDPWRDVTYLGKTAERVIQQRGGVIYGLDPEDREHARPDSVHVAYPVQADAEMHGVVVIELLIRPAVELQAVQRQLLWGAGWLEALLRRRQAGLSAQALDRAATVLDLVQAAQEQPRLRQAAMVVVNELATRCTAGRVSLGIQRRGKLELRAISRTAWFDRKSQLVETIENAMEEAIDQEAAVGHPAFPSMHGKVVVAQRDLGARAGAAGVLSVPLISSGRPMGALTLERDAAFEADTVKLCEALGALLGPALEARLDSERWFAGRIVDTLREWRDKLIGPRRPVLKLSVVLLSLAVLFLAFADGEFRISAKTVVEGSVQRAVVAPFEGFIREAHVRAGDNVKQGQVLAVLDDRDLKLEQVRWESEKEQAERRYREALAKHDRAASRILAAQQNQAAAQLALAEEKLARARLVAPFDGVVVSGDLSQLLGAPVELGKVLFELAPLDAYRVILKVDERDIAYVATGQHGELALTGLSHATLPFAVKTVTSVSTPQEGRNFFRVEAHLENAAAPLRPGMEGVGKIVAGERRLIWIWTRGFVDWLRISLWSWMP